MSGILHIAPGECGKEHLIAREYKHVIAFNEALNTGSPEKLLFTESFIAERVEALHTSAEEYHEKMDPIIHLKDHLNDWNEIHLWFGEDDFCQKNLEGLLIWLQTIGCRLPITLHIVEEEEWVELRSEIITFH